MPKGIPYPGEFKQMVVETMRNEKLGCVETAERFGIAKQRVCDWERIYLTEGPEALHVDRRCRGGKGKSRPPKFDKQLEEDLLAENQRLRAEVAYLKNCRPWFWRKSNASTKSKSDSETKARIWFEYTARSCSIAPVYILLAQQATEQRG